MANGLGLGNAYSATLGRIQGQGGEKARLGMAALMWISHSERPLKADELCHALAVEIGSPNLNTDNVPSIGTLLTCCQGLVLVDKEASTIRLIHFTLQEYLRACPELFDTAHSIIAETCLSYLNSHQVKALSTSLSPEPQSAPFLEYSSLYWGAHAQRGLSDSTKLLAHKLFDDYDDHISTKLLLKAQKPLSRNVAFDKPSLFSSLHCTSVFGIAEIAAGLVEVEGRDINQKDCVGNTPLVWAASNGHEEVVKILLGRDDVNPDKPDSNSQTALLCAAQNGHEGVVKVLLERDDIDPDKPSKYGRTALFYSAHNGHEGVVKILLKRGDVSPNESDTRGQTPLLCAARNGNKKIVKILLERSDISPDKPNLYGQTPLWATVGNGHEGVVKILLSRDDVNPDKPDIYGQTPFFRAAQTGQERMVKILLERNDVIPDKPDMYSRTPLCCAARNGHEGVVKILLEHDEVNPDKLDNRGRTPLWWAAERGHTRVVALLQPRVLPV